MRDIVKEDVPKIEKLLSDVLGSADHTAIERLGGLTNHTYHVSMKDGAEYVVRIPGEGTEEMIVRGDEKKSTELACRIGVDAKMLFFGDDGTKLTEYINEMEKKGLLVDEWNEDTAKREVEMSGGLHASDLAEKGKKQYSGNTYYQKMMLDLNSVDRGMRVHKWDY